MQLAFLLLVLVIAELVVSVWLLARHKLYLSQIEDLKAMVDKNESVSPAEDAPELPDNSTLAVQALASAVEVANNATPEEVEQAKAILSALGIE